MTDTVSDSPASAAPLPSRRQLRRLEEEARAAGEGPLAPEELLRRARAEMAAGAPGPAPESSPLEAVPREPADPPAPVAAAQMVAVAPIPGPSLAPASGASASADVFASFASPVDPDGALRLDAGWDPYRPMGPVTAALDLAGLEAAHGEPGQPALATPPRPADPPPHAGPPASEAASAPASEAKDYGRAGRNLPAAIGVGAILGGGVLTSLILYPPSFVVIVLVGVCLATWELGDALKHAGAHVSKFSTIVAAGCMVIATAFGGREALWVAFTAGAGAVLLFTLLEDLQRRGNAVKDVCVSLFALTYVGLMASFVVHLLSFDAGNLLVICFLALVVASDIGGYIAGTLLGRHPIAPKISPKKSWEGFAGSALMATAVGMGMAHWAFGAPLWTGAVLGIVIPAFATLGDFSESMIKRDLGLKDMGSLLPGHGGVMDRLDSILPTAPVALVLFTFLPGFITG
ncbi:phosphatidate cytidylyltransferase [Brevibacterium album]|uniref:phosphatidate cytidylyltransferase n=1 Tax=Brevibacterium album TaxID=417948 RepID=UPI00041A7135|nr:phosphatidate cytidylyltransferase [Brevibacterium album]